MSVPRTKQKRKRLPGLVGPVKFDDWIAWIRKLGTGVSRDLTRRGAQESEIGEDPGGGGRRP